MINPGLIQKLYNMIPYIPILKPKTPKPTIKVACISKQVLSKKRLSRDIV